MGRHLATKRAALHPFPMLGERWEPAAAAAGGRCHTARPAPGVNVKRAFGPDGGEDLSDDLEWPLMTPVHPEWPLMSSDDPPNGR